MPENIDLIEEFLREFYDKDLIKILKEGKKSLDIDFQLLDKFNPELADDLLNNPDKVLMEFKNAIENVVISEEIPKIEPRIKNLPESNCIRIRNIRSEHIGKLIQIDGVVRRASEVKPEILYAIFECPDCGKKIKVKQVDRTLKTPFMCETCGRKGGFDQPVDRILYDGRWIVIEEPFELSTGDKPGQIKIYLKDDLTSPDFQRKTDPGNRLKVVGILKEIKRMIKGKTKTQLDIYLEANHVEPTEIEWEEIQISEEDEKKIKELAKDPEIFKKIVGSIATSIQGMEKIKEGIALQLFGGVPQTYKDGSKLRGDIHVLLVGDPALGKTQILKLVSKIIPRGKYVSGKGITGVGLTATVTKDEEFMGGWVLEAGAMVLCHKGIIAIDEFDKMEKEDQVAMHEAMSTQTISVAKASIVATLPSQTTVLAGANPKYGRFDPYRSIAEQVNIPETLLSRFDLKFILRDVPDRETDEKIVSHIIESKMKPTVTEPIIPTDLLRKYIAYARHKCFPQLTEEAANALKEYYLKMRSMYIGEDVIAITLRQYEGLVRLAEASAKIRLKDKVEIEDAQRAIDLMDFSIRMLGYDKETGKIDIDRTEGTSSSKRNKIRIILDIIDKLILQFGSQIPKEEIVVEAENEGVTESEAEVILNDLKREGVIFEPKPNHIQKV